MKSKLLLKPLDNGFNYGAIKEIESLCADCIVESSPNDSPFIFIIRQICFDICQLIESVDGSTSNHDKIEQPILPVLRASIASLDSETISDKLEYAHNLIGTLRNVRKDLKYNKQ